MDGTMPNLSISSTSEFSSMYVQPLINTSGIAKSPSSEPRTSAVCVSDLLSPFQQLEGDAKSLFPLVDHCELPTISPDLLSDIMTGKRDFPRDGLVIIDTRHKFEYDGGHIIGALNLNSPSCIEEYYTSNLERGTEIAMIFHCEFSSTRAPKFFRHIRNIDRQAHIEVYPELGFPHMYILLGGYKAFFHLHPELCNPKQYVRMADPVHAEELRASNKSLKRCWNARTKYSKNSRIRQQDGVLSDVSNFTKRTNLFSSGKKIENPVRSQF